MSDQDDAPRSGGDGPTPWALGIVIGVVAALFVGCVVVGIYDVVGQMNIVLGVVAVLVVCGGVLPTAWTWRARPVVRWPSWGALAGAGVAVPVVLVLAIAGVP